MTYCVTRRDAMKILDSDAFKLVEAVCPIVSDKIRQTRDQLNAAGCAYDLTDDMRRICFGDMDLAEHVLTVLTVVEDKEAVRRIQEAIDEYETIWKSREESA